MNYVFNIYMYFCTFCMCTVYILSTGPGGIGPWPGGLTKYCPSVLDTVGWVIWPVKIVPDMTYNVFGGTLNPTLLLDLHGFCTARCLFVLVFPLSFLKFVNKVLGCRTLTNISFCFSTLTKWTVSYNKFLYFLFFICILCIYFMVTTCLENLEMSGN